MSLIKAFHSNVIYKAPQKPAQEIKIESSLAKIINEKISSVVEYPGSSPVKWYFLEWFEHQIKIHVEGRGQERR